MAKKAKKPKMGQPCKYGTPMGKMRGLRLPADLDDRVAAKAKKLKRKWSDVARELIEKGLGKDG